MTHSTHLTPASTAYLQPVLADLATLLDAIPAAADTAPTPCHDYDVAALRGHVLGWLTAFTDGLVSENRQCSDPDAVTVRGRGGAQVRELAGRLERALPAAAYRPLSIGDASMPGELALSMMLWEYQVHGWDLARATGQSWAPEEEGLRSSLAFAPGMLTPEYQGEGRAFAPPVEVADDAPALDRLVGLSGRDPGWSPR